MFVVCVILGNSEHLNSIFFHNLCNKLKSECVIGWIDFFFILKVLVHSLKSKNEWRTNQKKNVHKNIFEKHVKINALKIKTLRSVGS